MTMRLVVACVAVIFEPALSSAQIGIPARRVSFFKPSQSSLGTGCSMRRGQTLKRRSICTNFKVCPALYP